MIPKETKYGARAVSTERAVTKVAKKIVKVEEIPNVTQLVKEVGVKEHGPNCTCPACLIKSIQGAIGRVERRAEEK